MDKPDPAAVEAAAGRLSSSWIETYRFGLSEIPVQLRDDIRCLTLAYLHDNDPTPLTVERLVEEGFNDLLTGLSDFAADLEAGKCLEDCGTVIHVNLLPLVWTDAKPTVPGWYWYRWLEIEKQEEWKILSYRGGPSMEDEVGFHWGLNEMTGQFAGPIPLPAEPANEGGK